MGFEEEYQAFLNAHLQARTGERLRRLQEGHNQAEMLFLKQVWWPLYHHFKFLHPEYEVDDFKDGKRYLDFAFCIYSSCHPDLPGSRRVWPALKEHKQMAIF